MNTPKVKVEVEEGYKRVWIPLRCEELKWEIILCCGCGSGRRAKAGVGDNGMGTGGVENLCAGEKWGGEGAL